MLFAASDNYRMILPKSIICINVIRTPSHIYDGMFPFITGAYKSSKYASDLYFLFVNLKKKLLTSFWKCFLLGFKAAGCRRVTGELEKMTP